MIIYIDESKRLGKWEIVIWWFLSFHNTHYIEKFIANKKKEFDILKKVELKSTNKFWKLFLEKIARDNDFKKLKITTFAFHFDNYFFDSSEIYTNLLLKVLNDILNNKNLKSNIKTTIVHDNINAKSKVFISRKIEKILKIKWIKSEFKIHNSKKYLSLQLADLIVWEYKKLYFFDDINILEDFLLKKDINNKKT